MVNHSKRPITFLVNLRATWERGCPLKFVIHHFGGLGGNRERKFFQIRIFNGSNPEEKDFDKDTARINSILSEYST